MTATASAPVQLGAPRLALTALAGHAHPVARGAGGVVDVSRPMTGWRWRATAADGLWLVAVAWSVPIVVLVVGTPIALAIIALLWAVRSALGAS